MHLKAIAAPEWLRRSAVYQVNPRTFSAEGTLKSVEKELPFLRSLGFRIVYLCPIFPADPSEELSGWSERQKKYGTENPKNPYRMDSYFGVDEEYGSEEDLRELIAAAHALGMRVLLDLVYFHIGPNAPILKRHPEFAVRGADGSVETTIWHFPHLNFDSDGLREYLWCNMVYLIAELDADGFRCDVGDGVPLSFWHEARRRIRAVKPDAVLLNEGLEWIYLTEAFDASYCFTWHELTYAVVRGEKPAAVLRDYWETTAKQLPEGALLLRDIDNHDTVTDWPERTETAAGHAGMELIEVMNYLIDGVPMVYCGNELADTARINMFANRFHPGRYEFTDREKLKRSPEGGRRMEVMRVLNDLRDASDVLAKGQTRWQDTDAPDRIVDFSRVLGGEELRFIGNLTAEEVTFTPAEAVEGELLAPASGCDSDGESLTLPGWGFVVLRRRAEA